MQRCK